MNGKGDSPRNCFSEEYRENYDAIFRKGTMKSNDTNRDRFYSLEELGPTRLLKADELIKKGDFCKSEAKGPSWQTVKQPKKGRK